jgi:hypothetical protein
VGAAPLTPSRVPPLLLAALVVGLVVGLGAGCNDVPPPDAGDPTPPARLAGTPSYDARREPAEAVLPLVPATATTLTLTDLDGVRRQLGVPDLTSEDLLSDRSEFWRRAETEAALLTAGMLREVGSTLMLDYGFTEDDVDWEAHFTGPDGNGFVLGMRPDLDLAGVTRAVADGVGPLAGARVLPDRHLVVSGTTDDAALSWATDPAIVPLVGEPAEATYLRRGCVPLAEALGPDASAEDQDAVLVRHDVTDLDELAGFAVAFGDHLATVRLGRDRADLFARRDLAEGWPGRDPAFGAGFTGAAGDPTTGRIGYDVPRPPVAVGLVLTEELPFAVCNETTPIPEPTGL